MNDNQKCTGYEAVLKVKTISILLLLGGGERTLVKEIR